LEVGALCGAFADALREPAAARSFSSSELGIAPAILRPLAKNRVGVLLM
jgi:hypothetical protein